MFERFTNRARRVVVLAQEEARLLHHDYIGTEHLLLGIIHEGEGAAVAALRAMDVDTAVLGEEVKSLVGRGERAPSGHIPFTRRAKKTLELSLREALQLDCDYIGTEHILLGLIREGEGTASQVLTARGVTLDLARGEVSRLLDAAGGEKPRRGDQGRGGAAGPSLEDISVQLRGIGQRLAAIELKLGIEPSPAQRQLQEIDLALTRVRRQKQSAIEEQDFERAARLREEEKTLLTSRREAEQAGDAPHGDDSAESA